MKYSKNIWEQLKGIEAKKLIEALKKDNWILDETRKSTQAYMKNTPGGNRRVVIHYHPGKTYRSPKLLKIIFDAIGWREKELKKLKLIK